MRNSLILIAFLPLCACTLPKSEYPSLAIRDIERVNGTMQPAEPEPDPLPAPLPANFAEIQSLADTARAAHQRFLAAEPAARSRVNAARGAGSGSEAWAVAQVSLAGLESIRSDAMIAMADIDRLYVAAATEGSEIQELGDVRGEIVNLIAAEDATIRALLYRLAR